VCPSYGCNTWHAGGAQGREPQSCVRTLSCLYDLPAYSMDLEGSSWVGVYKKKNTSEQSLYYTAAVARLTARVFCKIIHGSRSDELQRSVNPDCCHAELHGASGTGARPACRMFPETHSIASCNRRMIENVLLPGGRRLNQSCEHPSAMHCPMNGVSEATSLLITRNGSHGDLSGVL
jgi:hypothetical protein